MIREIQINESIIAKAGLSQNEAMVMRVFAELKSAGGEGSRTRKFVKGLNERRYNILLASAKNKIGVFLARAGK